MCDSKTNPIYMDPIDRRKEKLYFDKCHDISNKRNEKFLLIESSKSLVIISKNQSYNFVCDAVSNKSASQSKPEISTL